MATYTLKGFSRFPFNLAKGLIHDLSDNSGTIIKCALFKDAWTPAQNSDDSYDDIKSHEITGDGTLDPDSDYPAGGLTAGLMPAGASVSVNGRVTTIDYDDPSQDNCTIGCYKLAFIDATSATDSLKKLIAYCILDGLKASNSGTFKVVLNTAGLFTMTVPA